jgi:hypothetical protein
MHNGTLVDWRGYSGRALRARRTRSLPEIVPSQDVTRYQARTMPRPTYDLNHRDDLDFRSRLLTLALVAAAIGAALIVVQILGSWLAG